MKHCSRCCFELPVPAPCSPALCRQCIWWQRWEERVERARLPYNDTQRISRVVVKAEPVALEPTEVACRKKSGLR